MSCESMIQVMLYGDNGDRPLDLGRRSREPSRKQRRAVRAMYPTCRFPGECDVPSERCHVHYVLWWGRDRGPTDLDNLVPLCTRHHKLVHEGGWELVVGVDGRLVAIAPDGPRCEASSTMASERTDPDAARRRLHATGVVPDGRELAGAWAG